MTTDKPIAELRILPRPSGALTYLLYDAEATLLLELRGYSTEHGKAAVREKLKAWNNGRYKIVLKEAEAAA